MRMIIAERHMQILEYLYEQRGYPQRGKMISVDINIPQNAVYEYLKRLKRRGWVIVNNHTVVDKVTGAPFYTISPLGISALNYGIAERIEHEQ